MPVDQNIELPDLIKQKLNAQIKVLYLSLKDESHSHAAHNEQAKQGNTHFYLKIVSDDFKDLSLLQRHQKINAILREEYKIFHALRIKALSRKEYEHKNKT
jgi:BolA protein